jgi:hypothetical protein
MASPFPRLTPPQFDNPANLRFAYTGCQTVIYNRNVKRNKKREDLQLFGTAIHGGAKTIICKISVIMKKN